MTGTVLTAPSTPDGPARSLLDHLDLAAETSGTVHFVRSGTAVPFASIWREAHRCAAWLSRSTSPGDAVAGVLEAGEDSLIVLFGSWLAGRTFVSVPPPSRGMAIAEYVDQTNTMLRLAHVGTMFLPEGLAAMADLVDDSCRTLTYADAGRSHPAAGTTGADLVQFTSGSTGVPRGVIVDMAQLGANTAALSHSLRYAEHDIFFSWLPLSHDMGLVGMCLASLSAFAPDLGGASQLWLADPELFLRDPASWLRLADDVGGTVTMAPNFALDLAARKLRARSVGPDLSSLRCVVLGGETVSADTLDSFEAAALPWGLGDGVLCPGYGLAEATLAVTGVRPGSPWTSRPDPTGLVSGRKADAEVVGLGPPVPGTCVRTAADADGQPEVQVSGPGVTTRFVGSPPALTPDGWLRTGDLGFLDDGQLFFVGRSSNRLVVAGRNIDGANLQHKLASLPGVRRGCCLVVPDGSTDFAVVVEAADAPAEPQMRDLCRSVASAAVELVGAAPSRVLVVEKGQLPKTSSGKPQPHRARSRLADGTLSPLVELVTHRHGKAS